MFVDYHMHLVDDYHLGPCPYTPERVAQYVQAAEARGVGEIGITDHCHRFTEFKELFRPIFGGSRKRDEAVNWLKDNLYEPLDRYFESLVIAKQRGLPVKIGLEVDWFSHGDADGAAEQIAEILAPYPLDYVLGSVHFLDDWPVDVSADYEWPTLDVEATYARYFGELRKAATSGLYDVLAHPDLIKKFGHRIENPTAHYEALVAACTEGDVALEISTAGLHYPVGELYPAQALLQLASERGVPVTFGSDAHTPEHVGRDLHEAVAAARQAGYDEMALFDRRVRRSAPLPETP